MRELYSEPSLRLLSDVCMETSRIGRGSGQIGGSQYINTDLAGQTAPHPERNDPTSVLRMRHQRPLLLAGTFTGFVASFNRLTPRVCRPVFTSWSPIEIPKITPHPTPPCLSGMSAGQWRPGT